MCKCGTPTEIKMQKHKCLLGYSNCTSCPPPGLSKDRIRKIQFCLFFPIRGVFLQGSVNLGLQDPSSIFLSYQNNSQEYEGTIGSKSDDFLRCRITKDILAKELSNEGQQIA